MCFSGPAQGKHRRHIGRDAAIRDAVGVAARSDCRSSGRTEYDVTAKSGEAFEILFKYISADRFQDNVDAPALGVVQYRPRPIGVVIADSKIGADVSNEGAALFRTCGSNNSPSTERLGDLHRKTTDAAGSAMDQNTPAGGA
jgi:hypothetical protein